MNAMLGGGRTFSCRSTGFDTHTLVLRRHLPAVSCPWLLIDGVVPCLVIVANQAGCPPVKWREEDCTAWLRGMPLRVLFLWAAGLDTCFLMEFVCLGGGSV